MTSGGSAVEKSTSLENLKVEIRKKFETHAKDIWLFPRGDDGKVRKFLPNSGSKVMGFWGTGEKPNCKDTVMIIAERPSRGRGKEPKEFDKTTACFYEFLEKNELDNSHLTDFIKTRAKVGYDREKPKRLKFYDEEYPRHLSILKKEIDIIKPNKIIALGEKTYVWVAICKSFLELKNVKLFCAPHYARAYRFNKTEEFEKEFARATKC